MRVWELIWGPDDELKGIESLFSMSYMHLLAAYGTKEGRLAGRVFLFLKPLRLPRIAGDISRRYAGSAVSVWRVSMMRREGAKKLFARGTKSLFSGCSAS